MCNYLQLFGIALFLLATLAECEQNPQYKREAYNMDQKQASYFVRQERYGLKGEFHKQGCTTLTNKNHLDSFKDQLSGGASSKTLKNFESSKRILLNTWKPLQPTKTPRPSNEKNNYQHRRELIRATKTPRPSSKLISPTETPRPSKSKIVSKNRDGM